MSWRNAGRGILKGITERLSQRPEPILEPPPPAPAAVPRPPKLTVQERAAAFTAEVWSLTADQLQALIGAWGSIDPAAMQPALDQARPSLTAADRKDVFTSVREELRRWQAGEARVPGGPASDIPSTLRLKASRVLLDAAMATIAQDRMAKRNFDVLYAPFRSATTGEPMHLPQTALARAGRRRAAGEDETADDAEPAAPDPEPLATPARQGARRSHARHATTPEPLDEAAPAQSGDDRAAEPDVHAAAPASESAARRRQGHGSR